MEMMSKDELGDFLANPMIARVATVRKNGPPHIAPVWFIYDGECVFISTGKDSAKARNIRSNPSVAIAIDTTEGGLKHKGVIFRGKAELVDKNVLETTKKIYLKYLGSIEDPMVKQLLEIPRVLIKLMPEKTLSWDYAKMRR